LPLPEAQTQIFFIQNSGKLAALPEEKLPHGGVFCQADRAVIGVRSFTRLPESLQEVSTHGPIRLVAGDVFLSNRVHPNGKGNVNRVRGQVATLTDGGFAALEAAAPGHVAAVRKHLIDQLSAEQIGQLEQIGSVVVAGLESPECTAARAADTPA